MKPKHTLILYLIVAGQMLIMGVMALNMRTMTELHRQHARFGVRVAKVLNHHKAELDKLGGDGWTVLYRRGEDGPFGEELWAK